MDHKELNGLMEAYMDVYVKETEEPDPFGRPGGKYGGVPKKGSGYDRAIQANKKAIEALDRKKANEDVELDEVTGFGGHIDPNTGNLTGRKSAAQQRRNDWRESGLTKDTRRSKHKTENPHNTATTPSHAGLYRGSAAWKDQNKPNLSMTPARRAELAAKRAKRQGEGKRANKILARIGGASTGSQNESYDLYDIILSHLLDEGYAETLEAAEVMMVNMSEGWRQSIVEGRDVERGEEDSDAVRAHNKSLKGKDGKPLYPSGRAGYARRPDPSKDPRYGSQR